MRTVLLLLLFTFVSTKKTPKGDRILKDSQYGRFISTELNYTYFLSVANMGASKIVPMQDTSNDTFFRVGIIHRSLLENYTQIPMDEHLGDIKKKPWVPVPLIREELGNCLHAKYASVSENDFKYDKGVYGWLNLMKFSCASIGPDFYVYAMAFARSRFRLKQVYLRRQNSYWSTTGRSITTRDIQKIVETLAIQFSEYVEFKLSEELKMLNGAAKKNYNKGHFLRIPEETTSKLKELFPPNLKHISAAASRTHSFSTVAFPIKTRVIMAKAANIPQIVENFSPELSDEACEVMDSCNKMACQLKYIKNESYVSKTETHKYLKETVFSYKITPAEHLLVYQVAKPYYVFEITKRKTSTGIVAVRQEVDEDAVRIWESLLDQQFSLSMRMHFQNFFTAPDPTTVPSTFPPIISEEDNTVEPVETTEPSEPADTFPLPMYDVVV